MQPLLNKPVVILASLACLMIAVLTVTALSTNAAKERIPIDRSSKAVLRVEGMTCGGCVSTIQNSLDPLGGIDDVQVDLASNSVRIIFDSRVHANADQMAAAITASGYRASVVRILSSDQLQAQTDAMRNRSATTIASVGGVQVPRADFDAEMAHATSRYRMAYGHDVLDSDQGRRLLDRLKSQIAQRLIDERIQLQEVRRSGFTVDRTTVARQYQDFWQSRGFADAAAFEKELSKNGYSPDYFSARFENRVLINAYVDEKLFTANLNEIEKQRRYADWFANARLLAEVTYVDKEIERLVLSQSRSGGCGNTCSAK